MNRVVEWQKRLNENFKGPTGIVGERLMELHDYGVELKKRGQILTRVN